MQTNISHYFARASQSITPQSSTPQEVPVSHVKSRDKRQLPQDEQQEQPTRKVRAASPPLEANGTTTEIKVASGSPPGKSVQTQRLNEVVQQQDSEAADHALPHVKPSNSAAPVWESKDSRFVKFPCSPRCIKRWNVIRAALQTPVRRCSV